ncbi:MAG: OmpA family protein [Lewinella sp.]|nr:OmpA family protein [Lewinella sp.]
MGRTITFLVAAAICFSSTIPTQAQSVTPKDMWEVGLNGGYLFVAGDVQQKFGWGAGVHIRKATDHLFSIRTDFMYGNAEGATSNDRTFTTKWMSATGYGVFTLNNMRFDRAVRKFNYYAGVGVGVNRFETEFVNEVERGTIPADFTPHIAGIGGISVRVSKGFNVGIGHQAMIAFGRRSDLIDGTEKEVGVRTPFRDIVNYSTINLNFNIGKASGKSEPLYWVNPLDIVLKDLDEVKKNQADMLSDSDNDGVIDALDKEPNTPAEATVDTKGRTLDSDKDGVPDYKDKEPYYPPRAGEQVNAEGVVTNPLPAAGGVTEQRVRELIDEAITNRIGSNGGVQGGGGGGNGAPVTEWFLPMIHFGTDSYSIKYSDYGSLASIARMLKGNPNLRLVIIGHTDQTGDEAYNDMLSYQRANAVIEHLVNNHGIGRGRLVLQWKGKQDALVPSSASYMNRRVEFAVASPSDTEMDPPAATKGKSGY